MQTGAATVEDSMEIPEKVKNRTTIRSSSPASGYLSPPPKSKTLIQKKYMHSYVLGGIIYSSQDMEAA